MINSSYNASSSDVQIASDLLYSNYSATLADGGEMDTGWLDMSGIDKVQFSGLASIPGMNLLIESRADAAQTPLTSNTVYSAGIFFMFNVICRQNQMRFRWQNNTGGPVSNVSAEIKASYGSSDKLSVFPVSVQPSDFSQAALVQSITRGLSVEGTYEAVSVNEVGATLVSDFGTEVSRKKYPGYAIGTKFGRNPQIDVGTASRS